MPGIVEVFDQLRGRFLRCRRQRPYQEIARSIGVAHGTLKNFANGLPIGERQAGLIEAWCALEERDTHAGGRP